MSLDDMRNIFNSSNTSLIKQINNSQSVEDLDNILVKDNIDIDTIKYLIDKYFSMVNENNRYDNKSKILSIIVPININKFISIDNLSCLDIIDFFRYKQYYINDLKIQDDNIIDILKFNRSTTEIVTVNGIKYTWNKRKNYFNILRHGLDFSKAVDLIKDGEYIKDREQDTYKIFVLSNTNTFLIVEFDVSNGEKRILSFRKSTLKEYDKAKEDSVKWSWIEKK